MQKKAYLFTFVGLALFITTFYVLTGISKVLFPIQAESRVVVVFGNAINENNFVGSTEGAQKILNTMVNVADFVEVRNKVINSGFLVTDNIFNGSAKENANTWRKHVSIKPVDDAFVLKITTGGRNQVEAKELAAVVAHEISLEIPKLFPNLRGISDQPRQKDYQPVVVFIYVFGTIVIAAWLFVFWKFLNKKEKDNIETKKFLVQKATLEDKKIEGDPRYFLQKFLEEHQKQKKD